MSQRAEHRVTLLTTDGKEVDATVKKPNIDVTSKVDAITVRLAMIAEQRKPLWLATVQVNRDLALAELALENAPKDKKKEAQDRHDTAKAAYDAIQKQIAAKDKMTTDLFVEQAQLVLNIPKGDADKAPKIDWLKSDLESLNEAVIFFKTGKQSLPTKSDAEN